MISWGSKITQTVLSFLLLNPEEELYLNEMARQFGVDRGNLARKLREWENKGLVVKSKRGNLSLYRINGNHPLYKEYGQMAQKYFGLEKELKHQLERINGLAAAYIFGSYAKGRLEAESDIDLLLIGEHDFHKAQKVVADLQKKFGREINVVDMTRSEFARKKNTGLIKNIFAGEHIKIF